MLLASTVNRNIYIKVPKSRKSLANYHPRMSLLGSFSYQLHVFSWSLCTHLFKSFPDWGYGHSFKDTPTSLDFFWSQHKPHLENRWKMVDPPNLFFEVQCMQNVETTTHTLHPLSRHSELPLPYASFTASWLWVLPKLFLEFWDCLWKTDLHYIC